MNNAKANNYRKRISDKLLSLRRKRGFTQAELAKRLGLGQGTYSRVEHGNASLSAEQFLEVLAIFNVTASAFNPREDLGGDIQNALLRLGASHLLGDTSRLPDDRLDHVGEVFREVLADGTQSRHITSLAPVFVRCQKDVHLKRLWAQFVGYGLENRLGWALENIRKALSLASGHNLTRQHATAIRAAERALDPFLLWAETQRLRIVEGHDDLLGLSSLGAKSRNEVLASSSDISRRWGVISRILPEDFFEALRAADVAR
ncbi:MAG: helix-turn-helix transcriptional regulator [Holophagaceae bacterium]|nr:helix-turn-helix transcriptional regulator [Holophagaceae bacterium]